MASPRVTTCHVEATSYPDRARAYGVRAVPHTQINGDFSVIGAVPEAMLLEAIDKALSAAT